MYKQIIKNTYSAWLFKFSKLILSIFLVPLLLNSFGKEVYSLIAIVIAITGIFGLFDLGFKIGLQRFLTEQSSNKDFENFNRIFSFGILFYSLLSLIFLILLYVLTDLLFNLLDIDLEYYNLFQFTIKIYGSSTILYSFLIPVFSSVCTSQNRFDLLNFREFFIGNSSLILQIILLHFNQINYKIWVLILVIFQIISLLTTIYMAKKTVPSLRFNYSFSINDVKKIFQFSLYTTLGGISRKLKFEADPIFITKFSGLDFLALFKIGITIPNNVRPIINSLTTQLTAISTKLSVEKNHEKLKNLLILGTKYSLMISLIYFIYVIGFGQQLINIWLSDTLSPHDYLLIYKILLFSSFIEVAFYLEGSSYSILFGMNKIKFMTKLDFVLAVLNIICSFLLIQIFKELIWIVLVPTAIIEFLIRPYFLYYTANQLNLNFGKVIFETYLPNIKICALPVLFVITLKFFSFSTFTTINLICSSFLFFLISVYSIYYFELKGLNLRRLLK